MYPPYSKEGEYHGDGVLSTCNKIYADKQVGQRFEVFLALSSYLHSSYGASTRTQGVHKESVGSCIRASSLGESKGRRGGIDQRGCYGNGRRSIDVVILSRRKHTDPILRVALRKPKNRCTKYMQKREIATDMSVGMVRYVVMRRREVEKQCQDEPWPRPRIKTARRRAGMDKSCLLMIQLMVQLMSNKLSSPYMSQYLE